MPKESWKLGKKWLPGGWTEKAIRVSVGFGDIEVTDDFAKRVMRKGKV